MTSQLKHNDLTSPAHPTLALVMIEDCRRTLLIMRTVFDRQPGTFQDLTFLHLKLRELVGACWQEFACAAGNILCKHPCDSSLPGTGI
jgi:hypothetical protein